MADIHETEFTANGVTHVFSTTYRELGEITPDPILHRGRIIVPTGKVKIVEMSQGVRTKLTKTK